MAKPSSPTTTTWGTWEDLLLSCAVHRYGTDSWDSVATELQKRIPSLKALTAHTCKLKYCDLKRRFSNANDVVPAPAPAPATNHNKTNTTSLPNNSNIPWLDELRQLRVAELKREVERYDLSIVSLQLKVKRLKEEREESEKEAEKSDLRKEAVKTETDDDDVKRREPENVTAGEDSDRENRSVNESNSTDPKTDSQGEAEKRPERVEPAGFNGPEPEGGEEVKIESGGRGGEDLCNSVAEESAGNSVRVNLGDSAGSSKGGKECSSSDVQSSASLSRKDEEEEEGEKPDEPEEDRSCNESQPLLDFLEILRSHKLGSHFERRLETQKTLKYNNLIRQHMDFETIRTKLEEGWYSGCSHKFFRDLLLLINNAIIFFGKKSAESLAAIELRKLVSKELAGMMSSPGMFPKDESMVPQDPGPSGSLSDKPKMQVLMIACRKRSSIATKASPLFCGTDKKAEQKGNATEEKPVMDLKQRDNSTDKAEESRVTKKRTRERFSSGSKSSNKNSKSRSSAKTNKNSDVNSNTTTSSTKGGSHNENADSKSEKEKKNSLNASSKKKGAANFLDRMKRSSPSSNRSLPESIKQPVNSSDNSKGGQQRRTSNNSKSDVRKDQNTGKNSGGKQTREGRSSAKRNPGRPPKRGGASPAPPPVVPTKRGRESNGGETAASGHAKKRSRR